MCVFLGAICFREECFCILEPFQENTHCAHTIGGFVLCVCGYVCVQRVSVAHHVPAAALYSSHNHLFGIFLNLLEVYLEWEHSHSRKRKGPVGGDDAVTLAFDFLLCSFLQAFFLAACQGCPLLVTTAVFCLWLPSSVFG